MFCPMVQMPKPFTFKEIPLYYLPALASKFFALDQDFKAA
jgi:hypothetical protein